MADVPQSNALSPSDDEAVVKETICFISQYLSSVRIKT
uniref:Uncharacterized protein n=1 Tax=Peronospora matthiolae TaxID=2874970 RepID=A0AAV1UG64_9STRA